MPTKKKGTKKTTLKKRTPMSKRSKREKDHRARNTLRNNIENKKQRAYAERLDENEKMFFRSLEQESTEKYPFAALKKREDDRNLNYLTDDEIAILDNLFYDEDEYSTPLPSPKPRSSFEGIIDIGTPASLPIAPTYLAPISPPHFDEEYNPYADMNFDLSLSKSKGGKRRITKKRKSRKIKKVRK